MRPRQPGDRLTILDLALMLAGASLGFWLVMPTLNDAATSEEKIATGLIFTLGGLALVGPPLLIWQRRRGGRRRLGPGEFHWFGQGTASWLLWPPIVYKRLEADPGQQSMAATCYFYGTPMMALFVAISLLSAGWLGRRRGRRRTGREAVGLILALLWACSGLYILSLIYRKDFE